MSGRGQDNPDGDYSDIGDSADSMGSTGDSADGTGYSTGSNTSNVTGGSDHKGRPDGTGSKGGFVEPTPRWRAVSRLSPAESLPCAFPFGGPS